MSTSDNSESNVAHSTTATASQLPAAAQTAPRLRLYYPNRLLPGPRPTVAFGFILDPECRRKWARRFHEELYPNKLATLSPEEAEEELEDMELATTRMLPALIYREFPDLPRLRNRLYPADPARGCPVPTHDIFVLRDNGTHEGKRAPLTPEDIEGVRRRLEVGDQTPQWYRVWK
ncbi:hypothetical protein C8Q76DRAFT_792606 [Earliella scabrosa]|nr:hypothetical protein C8Q76DRAFT_792606 [Earliella scabrosa]